MFTNYNGISSGFSLIYNLLIGLFSYYYFVPLSSLLVIFLFYRFPYLFTPFIFSVLLVCVLFSGFVSLFLGRVVSNPQTFFSSMLPIGTPLYIGVLVVLAETISYIIRPTVLIFRPFINISLGCLGAAAVGNFCIISPLWFLALGVLFFYEVFVALVHWFIVSNILSFSVDH
uniref:ATP synthase F0 subunit 6 n=1 Tax=Didymobothrium rudolphii TaxID=423277 RepID=A0A8F7CA08_9CEST|nr:ATP synthase F0 subunit 6 [Didymobothrium rudolphii]